MTRPEACLAECGYYALDVLQATDQNPADIKYLNKKPYSARIDGAQMEVSATFKRLAEFGYVEFLDGSVRVTTKGTDTLRDWAVRGAMA